MKDGGRFWERQSGPAKIGQKMAKLVENQPN
jgi:hypothetical protein